MTIEGADITAAAGEQAMGDAFRRYAIVEWRKPGDPTTRHARVIVDTLASFGVDAESRR
jgi:hypothetical protein